MYQCRINTFREHRASLLPEVKYLQASPPGTQALNFDQIWYYEATPIVTSFNNMDELKNSLKEDVEIPPAIVKSKLN